MIADHLALDISSTTIGWCSSYGGALQWGEETFKGTLDQRLGAFLVWLPPRMPSEVLVIEQPFVKHLPAAVALYAVAGIARALAASMGAECVLLSPADIKRHWTGKAHATKEEMAARHFPPGWTDLGEHEIDAIAAMSCYQHRDYKVKPKKKRRKKVDG